MAHIPDGILSAPVLIGGAVIAAGGIALAMRRIDDQTIIRTAILSATFFAGSLIAVPIGPSSVHLLFGGVMGLMLGNAAFLAVFVALILQALLFGFGGLTTLGVNAVNIALPSIVLAGIAGPYLRNTKSAAIRTALAALVGGGAALGTGAMVALSMGLSASEYQPIAKVLLATYVPLALVEAAVTVTIVGFLNRVQPDALAIPA
jgi:ABC-type Co2+ transport system, permease component